MSGKNILPILLPDDFERTNKRVDQVKMKQLIGKREEYNPEMYITYQEE